MGDSGQLGNQEEPHNLNRKGLLSQGSKSIAMKSRVNREVQARFCERLEVSNSSACWWDRLRVWPCSWPPWGSTACSCSWGPIAPPRSALDRQSLGEWKDAE